jgi:cobalt/nickel transport system permease protein
LDRPLSERLILQGRGLHRTFAIDEWNRRDSFLHRRDPRAKIIAVLLLLVGVSLSRFATFAGPATAFGGLAVVALTLGALAGVSPRWLLVRAALILPFTALFALLSALAGDPFRAFLLLAKAFVSALLVALLVATTPLDRLLAALVALGVPRFLADVVHFIWRYLHVALEQAWRLRTAVQLRGGQASFRLAAASVATLFATSYARAERIHRAILSRGAIDGRTLLHPLRFAAPDVVLLLGALGITFLLGSQRA